MQSLVFAKTGLDYVVKRIGGKPDVRKHLEHLGFVIGATVSVRTRMAGNLIVCVKGTRIAISREMAQKIMVAAEEGGIG